MKLSSNFNFEWKLRDFQFLTHFSAFAASQNSQILCFALRNPEKRLGREEKEPKTHKSCQRPKIQQKNHFTIQNVNAAQPPRLIFFSSFYRFFHLDHVFRGENKGKSLFVEATRRQNRMTSAIETLLQAAKFLELQEQGLIQMDHHRNGDSNNAKSIFEPENQRLSTSLSPIISELETFVLI